MTDLYGLAAPLLRQFNPETAHNLTIRALKIGLGPRHGGSDPASLATSVFGMDFPNPIGLAAGFDKNAEVPDAMLAMGFGFVEVGTITPLPQPGNPRPRLFRLEEDQAVINRLGFNNHGLAAASQRLSARARRPGIVGVNVGANKTSTDWVGDYVEGFKAVAAWASYVTVNVSSPNTPGLRSLQDKTALEELLGRLLEERRNLEGKASATSLLLKVAPDLTPQEVGDIAGVVEANKIDGLIVSNTTIGERGELHSRHGREGGGLSGVPLFQRSTRILADFFDATGRRLPLVGVGGIASGEHAYQKIRAGASLVQLYSALTFQGPDLIKRIKEELTVRLERDGFASIADAVGTAT